MHGDEFTMEDALKWVSEGLYEYWEVAREFHFGNHWQDGAGWIGPQPDKQETDYKTVMSTIAKAFVSKNVVAEVIKRHRNALLGVQPGWALAPRRPLETGEEPNEEELALIAEAEAILTDWWDKRKAYSVLQDAVIPLLYAGRITLRLFIPHERRSMLPDGSMGIRRLPPEEALKYVFLDVPDPDAANVYVDKDSMEPVGIYVYTSHGVKHAELTYLDEAENTVLKVLTQTGEEDAAEGEPGELRFDAGGHLWMYTMKRDPLVSPQVMQLQMLLNLAMTMMGRNVVQAGFLERLILNAQVPGKFVEETDELGLTTRRFVPDELTFGAGTTNLLQGITVEDEITGRTTIATPSVVYRDPVPVTTFTQTKREAYIAILEEVQQLHAFISGDATASGESRVQARAEFRADLDLTAPDIADAVRWMLEALLAVAAEFSGDPGRYSDLRADVQVRVNPGPLSPEERRVILEQFKEGVRSLQTTLALLGQDDVAAELSRLAVEGEQSLDQLEQRVKILIMMADITGIEAAAIAAGFDEKIAAKLADMAALAEPDDPEVVVTNEDTVQDTAQAVPANASPNGQGR